MVHPTVSILLILDFLIPQTGKWWHVSSPVAKLQIVEFLRNGSETQHLPCSSITRRKQDTQTGHPCVPAPAPAHHPNASFLHVHFQDEVILGLSRQQVSNAKNCTAKGSPVLDTTGILFFTCPHSTCLIKKHTQPMEVCDEAILNRGHPGTRCAMWNVTECWKRHRFGATEDAA